MIRQTVTCVVAALAMSAAVCAQSANPLTAEARQAYTTVKGYLLRAADKMPEADYGFKPVPEIRGYGELMAHIADSAGRSCGMAKGEQKAIGAASKKTKAEITAALKEAFDYCDTVYDSMTDAAILQTVAGRGGAQVSRLSILTANLAHLNEEYGYGAVYLRLKGIVPPSSDRTPAR